jgi:antitoxin CptB
MIINIEYLRKKIIYRSNYRGTKEMDNILSAFTKKYIDIFNDDELICLCDLLDYDDENLYKFNKNEKTSIKINENKVSELFKNFKYKKE